MFTGVYSAASAMDLAERRHEAASFNLANANLPGYRRRIVDQTAFRVDQPPAGMRQQATQVHDTFIDPHLRIDLHHGTMRRTESSLDFAIQGDGYFVVEGPDGPLYTRNGAFHVDAEGRLSTVDGLQVRGQNGPIQLPQGQSPRQLQVTQDGSLLLNSTKIDQLLIVTLNEPQQVQAVGRSLLAAPDETAVIDTKSVVHQGQLESSNVEPVEELVTILIGSRQYEAAQRIIRSLSDIARSHIQSHTGG